MGAINPQTVDPEFLTKDQLIEAVYGLRDMIEELGFDSSGSIVTRITLIKISKKHNYKPANAKTPNQEAKLLTALLSGRVLTSNFLLEAIARDVLNPPSVNLVKVVCCRLKKILALEDIYIETVWGTGYRMTPDNIAKFKALMERG